MNPHPRQFQPCFTLMHLLLVDNDTVPISVWCDGAMPSTKCPLVLYCVAWFAEFDWCWDDAKSVNVVFWINCPHSTPDSPVAYARGQPRGRVGWSVTCLIFCLFQCFYVWSCSGRKTAWASTRVGIEVANSMTGMRACIWVCMLLTYYCAGLLLCVRPGTDVAYCDMFVICSSVCLLA